MAMMGSPRRPGPAALWLWLWAAVAVATASPLTLDDVAGRLSFLKDYFKIHLYVNPHPACAMQAESCTLDNECCGGLECLMSAAADGGIGSVCQRRVSEGGVDEGDGDGDPDTDEVGWNFAVAGSERESSGLAEEALRERARQARRDEERLADTSDLIKELRRPLSLDEMISLRREQEANELRQDEQLRELNEWKREKDKKDEEKEREMGRIEALAKERVDRVLREEERQKMEMLHKMQAAIKTDNKQ